MRKLTTVTCCAGFVAACFWVGLALILSADVPGPTTDARAGRARAALRPSASGGAAPEAAVPARVRVDAMDADASASPPELDFDATVDRLVALGVSMWTALQLRDDDTVAARNTEAESLLLELLASRQDVGGLGLDRITRLPADATSIEVGIRRHVLERILKDALAARYVASKGAEEHGPLDALVDAMLSTLPLEEKIARGLGIGLLTDQPYLGPAQESAVLDLAELVAETPFLEPVVAGLLRTLWINLEATGARSSGRLASLAMLFLEDANPARRSAAAHQLLLDARYRDFALACVTRSRDRELATELAEIAATELPPADALAVLKEVQDLAGERLIAAYLALGSRDAALLAREYESVLADGVRPQLRAGLITGATAEIDRGSMEVAQVAFDHDPDPEVRIRALYALAMHPDPDVAEAAINAALDDPNATRDPGWVSSVVLALRNLANRGAVNALDRLGRRLERHPMLGDFDRLELRALLAEHVPGR